MAHYAKISNEEFTVSERARLMEAQSEKGAIEANNRASEEYATLKTAYEDSFTSSTLQTLEGELAVLQSEDTISMTDEEKTAHQTAIANKQEEIDAEKAALVPGQETALANLTAKELEGTEALTAEIETLNTTISNSLARVTAVLTGADEIEMVSGDTSALQAEIKVLEESKKNYPYDPISEEKPVELVEIENEIQNKVQQIKETPKVEQDNTVYWEGYIGNAKRTSYNTRAGVHQLGGTPFRKNYAGKGMIYNPVKDAFYGEQPYASWILNEDTYEWNPPTAKPEGVWFWKEDTTEWVDYVYFNEPKEKLYDSWTWNTSTGKYEPPIEMPNDDWNYYWDESKQEWIKLKPK